MSKRYAGIGSRSTPENIQDIMHELAYKLAKDDWILRTGDAHGADHAFSMGADLANGKTEIYVWADATPLSIHIASELHPAWDKCNDYAKKLHGRNAQIVLGEHPLDHQYSKFVVCWTPKGELVGGTAMGIRIAQKYNIPVFNLAFSDVRERITKYINED